MRHVGGILVVPPQVEVGAGVFVGALAAGDQPGPAAGDIEVGLTGIDLEGTGEVGDRSAPVAAEPAGVAAVAVDLHIRGPEPERHVVFLDRLLRLAKLLQGVAQAGVGRAEPRRQLDGGVVILDRAVEHSQPGINLGTVESGDGALGVELDRLGQVLDGRLVLAEPEVRQGRGWCVRPNDGGRAGSPRSGPRSQGRTGGARYGPPRD